MRKIVLASSSPRRKQLLTLLGVDFIIDVSAIEEKLDQRYNPREQVEVLSLQKAKAVAARHADALIIGADTMVFFGQEKIGKPKDAEDAKRILSKLSGTIHAAVTGFTLIDTTTGETVTKSVETKIWFRKLSEKEISNFVAKEKPFDKAGAYAIHELGAIFVEKIEGDFFAAVGLPIFSLTKELKRFGVDVL